MDSSRFAFYNIELKYYFRNVGTHRYNSQPLSTNRRVVIIFRMDVIILTNFSYFQSRRCKVFSLGWGWHAESGWSCKECVELVGERSPGARAHAAPPVAAAHHASDPPGTTGTRTFVHSIWNTLPIKKNNLWWLCVLLPAFTLRYLC